MSDILTNILQANDAYATDFGDKHVLSARPAKRVAILTCMDARIDPAKVLGLREGDAHIIRNAGGRASEDAIRSLVVSYKLLGTREWLVIHHTDCGMMTISDEKIAELLAHSLEPASYGPDGFVDTGAGPGSPEGQYINWLTFKDQTQCLLDDVVRLRRHPLVPGTIPIYGYIYDVKSGRLIEVPEATAAGQVKA
ncbi:MAG: carbonic anhydrase [Anaerolineae bacterium]|nr:carbonic anhydrase [Anaerolineae bacterium]